ncbi:unnamed protein product [Adineta ricciae]|uniref:Lipase domain-containing protein n=1 Tax=Adineta ricciae TaxID=249248 RepID=A0A813W3M1_ADIRI|nr:unnamed protein product [Adineta ricciae]CAF1241745.1 unnamed protein product [Adineta ricciae]
MRWYFLFVCVFTLKIQAVEYDTYFHVFSKSNPDKPVTIHWGDAKKWEQHKAFRTCPIKLIAHGYAERWNMDWRWDWVKDMKDEMLSNKTQENLCVVAIDWEKGAREANFITAVGNADVAGRHLAEFIQDNHIEPKRLHCIGFSLGAHLCAFASSQYFRLTNKTTKFARITGLDPSGPLLRKASVDKRLSRDDADFVDSIHTSTTFGLQEKSGHMDFFPDGGKSSAKGCEKLIEIKDEEEEGEVVAASEKHHRVKRLFFNKNKTKNSTNDDDDDVPKKNFVEKLRDRIGRVRPLKKVFLNIHAYIGCNHLRSPHYYISSINHCQFRAQSCLSWSDYSAKKCVDSIDNNSTYPRMGFYAEKSDATYRRGNGSFYLKTTSQKPYCSPTTTSSLVKKQTSKLKKKLMKLLPQRVG